MEISAHLIDAARETIREAYQEGALLKVRGYPAMFVEETGGGPGRQIRPFHFFTEGGKRFAIGTKPKSSLQLND